MSEILQETQDFEEGVHQLNTALRQTDQALSGRRVLEELLQQLREHIVLREAGDVITEDQMVAHRALIVRACQALLCPCHEAAKEEEQ